MSFSQLERIELQLVQRDLEDLIRAMLGINGHPDSGAFVFSMLPVMGLVTEESFNYVRMLERKSKIITPQTKLFSEFSRRVTKMRCRIKLFDDNDGYAEGLVEMLDLAHEKSEIWFNSTGKGFIGALRRFIQPDLGVFFVGENLISTTHVALPVMGITKEELESYSRRDMDDLGKKAYEFTVEVGSYHGQLTHVLDEIGYDVNLNPKEFTPDIHVTNNDFVGHKFYSKVADSLRLADNRYVCSAVMALAHINSALLVLPNLLKEDSNLLIRASYLTAYHTSRTLSKFLPNVCAELPAAQIEVLENRELRNVCAHYGLRKAGEIKFDSDDYFESVIRHFTSLSKIEFLDLLDNLLRSFSRVLSQDIQKSDLLRFRSRLGSNT